MTNNWKCSICGETKQARPIFSGNGKVHSSSRSLIIHCGKEMINISEAEYTKKKVVKTEVVKDELELIAEKIDKPKRKYTPRKKVENDD